MNRGQVLVVVIGTALLAMNFLFPLTSFPVTIVEPKIVRNIHQYGLIPIWETLNAQQQPPIQPQRMPQRAFRIEGPFGKVWGLPRILWSAVSFMAAVIVLFMVIFFNRFSRKKGMEKNLVEGIQKAGLPKH